MVKKIALIAVAVIGLAAVAVLAIAMTKPDKFVIERSITINAAPEKIYPLMSDLHGFAKWSPYEEKDPKMKRTFSGAESGKGAVYAWDGNDEVGAGTMTIAEANAPTDVKVDLHFIKPMQGDNVVHFKIVPEANGSASKVSWSMEGDSPLMCKVMQVFMNMDDMCGNDFAKGLAKLKSTVETQV